MRKEIAPKTPDVSTCKKCGAPVYVVSDVSGKEVQIDVAEMEITTVAELFYGRTLPARWVAKQLSLAWNMTTPCRRRFRDKAVMTVGGFKLLEPQWFAGHDMQWAQWSWYVQRVELAAAYADRVPIHAEHFTTCVAMDRRRLLAELSALHLEGTATGDRRPEQRRLLILRQTREHEASLSREHDESGDESAHSPAKGHYPTTDRSAESHRLLC